MPDNKPFLLLVQKTNIFGVSMDKIVNGTPELAGLIPLSGLNNVYDADFDPLSNEVGPNRMVTNFNLPIFSCSILNTLPVLAS